MSTVGLATLERHELDVLVARITHVFLSKRSQVLLWRHELVSIWDSFGHLDLGKGCGSVKRSLRGQLIVEICPQRITVLLLRIHLPLHLHLSDIRRHGDTLPIVLQLLQLSRALNQVASFELVLALQLRDSHLQFFDQGVLGQSVVGGVECWGDGLRVEVLLVTVRT